MTANTTRTKRVRRTNAQIAADKAAEEARIQELAAERAAKIPAPKSPKFSKTYHIVTEAGYTALGNVWYRGQEFTVEEGTKEFELAFDRMGNYIFDMSEDDQIDRYGEVMFREGPWPGRPYDENIQFESDLVTLEGSKKFTLTPAERELLRKVNSKRKLG